MVNGREGLTSRSGPMSTEVFKINVSWEMTPCNLVLNFMPSPAAV